MKRFLILFSFLVQIHFAKGQALSFTYNFGSYGGANVICNDDQASPCTNFFTGQPLPFGSGGFNLTAEPGSWTGNTSKNLFSLVQGAGSANNFGGNVFQFRAGSTNNKATRFAIDKFGTTGSNTEVATPTAALAFRFKFGNDGNISETGDIVFAFGKSEAGFSSGSSIADVNLQSSTIFCALKFSLLNNTISTSLYNGTGWMPLSLGTPIVLGSAYNIELYANNSGASISTGSNESLPTRNWYLRLNGIKYPTNENVYFSQIGGVNLGLDINSFMLSGYTSQTNSFHVFVDDFFVSTSAATTAALPASLGNFKLNSVEGINKLNWITTSETNNKGFEIQRSIGAANDFKKIGFVGTRAKDGNSQSEISYNFEDIDVKAGQTYNYRLNQIDFDGKSSLSPIRSIKTGSIESNLNVYPNPSQGSVTLNTGSTSGKLNIYVLDNTGRTVNQYLNVSTSNTRISNLKKGLYTLKIVNTETGEQSTQRLVVQ